MERTVPLLASRRVVLGLVGAAASTIAFPAVAEDSARLVERVAAQVIDIVKTKQGAARQAAVLQAAYAPWLALDVADREDGWILMSARRPA